MHAEQQILETHSFTRFLKKAKQNTYAGGGDLTTPSRNTSKDLHFAEGDFVYLDSYLGDFNFIGEEAVWYKGKAIWGMNYYGRMLIPEIPNGFSTCLKNALLEVPEEMPFRGPEEYISNQFVYNCTVEGEIEWFRGKEFISYQGKRIYQLYFHGGALK